MSRIAIDFGTSNTLIAAWQEISGSPRTIRLSPYAQPPAEGMPAVIPSQLYLQDAAKRQALIGAEVRAMGQDLPGDRRFFAGFKRAIAADVLGFSPRLDDVEVTSRVAAEIFLEHVIGKLKSGGQVIDEAVFTVPVQAFERYLAWLGGMANRLGIENVRLIDESTAAAMGYQVLTPEALLLVVDFGGGTLDVSLVRAPASRQVGLLVRGENAGGDRDRVASVVAKAGHVLGGEDIDHWLIDDFLARHRLSRAEVSDDMNQLKDLAERVKVKLSTQPQAELTFFLDARAKTFQTVYTRSELEDLLERHDFYAKIQGTLDQVLRQAEARGVRRADVAQVLLVGGTTLIPSVQRAVRQNFSQDRVKSHAPFEAVAHGALHLLAGTRVEDYLYHGYGIRYWDARQQKHGYEPIFQPGLAYPTREPVDIVLRASKPGQPAIELVIGEMEALDPQASEVLFDGQRLIATSVNGQIARVVALNEGDDARTIAKLEPPGYPGVDRIRVTFRVDDGRRLRVTVDDLQTGSRLMDDAPVLVLR